MEYGLIIDNYISKRYDYLVQCAGNILRKNNKTSVTKFDLVSELTIFLLENREKVDKYIKINQLEGFCVSWMNTQGKYETSQVNIKFNKGNWGELDEVMSNELGTPDINIELSEVSEYEKDLHNILEPSEIEKIMKIDAIVDKLTQSELILFKAYFIENLSYDKIVKKYTFFREKDGKTIKYKCKKSVFNMMRDLKEKINSLI